MLEAIFFKNALNGGANSKKPMLSVKNPGVINNIAEMTKHSASNISSRGN